MTGYDAATVALLPCPFCSGVATMQPWHGGAPTKQLVSCSNEDGNCEAAPAVTGETSAEAIAVWNRRALPIAPPAPLQEDKISPVELSAMFGDSMPLPVFDYLFSDEAPKRSTAEVRFALRKLGVLIPLAAPPAPLVTADDVELIDALRKAVSYYRANDWFESDTELLTEAADALARAALNREGNG